MLASLLICPPFAKPDIAYLVTIWLTQVSWRPLSLAPPGSAWLGGEVWNAEDISLSRSTEYPDVWTSFLHFFGGGLFLKYLYRMWILSKKIALKLLYSVRRNVILAIWSSPAFNDENFWKPTPVGIAPHVYRLRLYCLNAGKAEYIYLVLVILFSNLFFMQYSQFIKNSYVYHENEDLLKLFFASVGLSKYALSLKAHSFSPRKRFYCLK